MSQQNRSAQRRPANVVPDLKQELQTNANQQAADLGHKDFQQSPANAEQSGQSKVVLLDRYSQLLDDLNIEYAETTQAYTNIESDIMNREIACGQLMRQYLELGEQIRFQKETISTQREKLKRTQTMREKTSRERDAVVKKIATLASSSSR